MNLRIDEAAKKIGVPEETLRDWESGSGKPTLVQARKVARVYGRPLAVFYLEGVPEDFAVIRDFRRVSVKEAPSTYPYHLVLLIRELQARQVWLREILEELNSPRLTFVNSVRLDAPPSVVGAAIRDKLKLSDEEQLSWKSLNAALNEWVYRVETVGVFVSQTSVHGMVNVTDARGFALVDSYAPYVFINTKDSLGGRIFTLAHEFAHIWIGESGVSGEALAEGTNRSEERVERFCNAVASNVVFPDQMFTRLFSDVAREAEATDRIPLVARQASISRDVVARRLLDKGIVSRGTYDRLHAQYVREWRTRQDESRSGGDYYVNHTRAISKAFTRLVADVYSRGRITGPEAASLLQAKLDRMSRLVHAAQDGGHD